MSSADEYESDFSNFFNMPSEDVKLVYRIREEIHKKSCDNLCSSGISQIIFIPHLNDLAKICLEDMYSKEFVELYRQLAKKHPHSNIRIYVNRLDETTDKWCVPIQQMIMWRDGCFAFNHCVMDLVPWICHYERFDWVIMVYPAKLFHAGMEPAFEQIQQKAPQYHHVFRKLKSQTFHLIKFSTKGTLLSSGKWHYITNTWVNDAHLTTTCLPSLRPNSSHPWWDEINQWVAEMSTVWLWEEIAEKTEEFEITMEM